MRPTIRRGDIFDVDFGEVMGGMQDVRPALVVQNDLGNEFSPYTIISAIHHDEGRALPILVKVRKGFAGLSKDSVIDCGHIATLPKNRLARYRGRLPVEYQTLVDVALKRSLGL